MADWCLYLIPVFQEAVERVVQMPLKKVFAYGIIDKFQTSPVLEKFPKQSCTYLIAILKAEDYPMLHSSLPSIYEKFKKTISGTAKFREFEELLYLRGWKASERKTVGRQRPPTSPAIQRDPVG